MLNGISRNLTGTLTQTKNTDQRTTDSCSQTDKTHPWSSRSRRIFHDEDLVGRKFFGQKGRLAISPRRRNCLKPALLEYYGSNYTDFSKAVNSINNEVIAAINFHITLPYEKMCKRFNFKVIYVLFIMRKSCI